MEFQRARSDEQREVRRRAILETAAAMLEEMAVSELSLNELSRRVGLAKSNVLRYFESREAVLLELLDHAFRQWVAEISDELPTAIDPKRPPTERGQQLAAVLSRSLGRQSVLCDLLHAQAGVLEQNVSTDGIVRFKRSGYDSLATLADAVRRHVPELGDDARTACLIAVIMAGALWNHTRPSPNTLAAYEVDPNLADLRFELPTALERTLTMLITGALATGGKPPGRRPRRSPAAR